MELDDRRPLVVGVGALNTDCVVPDPRATLLPRVARLVTPPLVMGAERRVDATTMRLALKIADPQVSQVRLGGSAYNTITALAATRRPLRLGYVGVAGSTPARTTHLQAFADHGVEHHLVGHRTTTGGMCLALTAAGDRAMLVHEGANADMADHLNHDSDTVIEYLAGANIVHVTSFLDEQTPAALLPLLRGARQRNPRLRISVDPGHEWCTSADPNIGKILDLADYLYLTSAELAALRRTEHTDEGIAQRLLRRMPPGAAVISKTAAGARTYQNRKGTLVAEPHTHRPLPTERVVNSVGAGDTFAAGVLAAVTLNPGRLRDGVRLGMALARHAIQHQDLTGAAFKTIADSHSTDA
ncbi:carbohydrate kinase family protein [Micromonospora sp. NPDC048898]|uniref:carbohydrate kinase family protein n=1 Tax=Micromonospora sp. NPDC048898 TaxID=3364260 RepID=UPI00371769D0